VGISGVGASADAYLLAAAVMPAPAQAVPGVAADELLAAAVDQLVSSTTDTIGTLVNTFA